MSPSSSQSWTRRIRPGYNDNLRVSDAERQQVADLLGRHYSDGRLDKTELDDRVSRAMSAKTRGDLNGLFDDLPDTDDEHGRGADGTEEPDDRDGSYAGGLAAPYRVGRRGGRAHPVLVIVAAIVAASIAGHVLLHVLFIPWLPIIALIAVVALVNRNRHDRYRR